MLRIEETLKRYNQNAPKRLTKKSLALAVIPNDDLTESTKINMMQRWLSHNYASLRPEHITSLCIKLETTPNDLLGWRQL